MTAALASSSLIAATSFTIGPKIAQRGMNNSRRSFLTSTTSTSRRSSLVSKKIIPSTVQKESNKNSSTTGLAMIFGNLFGGGAFNLKIDYSTLNHPGPELASAAQEGKILEKSVKNPNLKLATFAGGCFWGLELVFQRVPGVVETAVGYTQGQEAEPTYDQVCAGATGHTEAVVVYYDPKECTYDALLDAFFQQVNPTTVNGQGRDYGKQYRTGVYYHSDEQESIARKRFEQVAGNYKWPIATECKKAMPFWPAEKYHQQYLSNGGRFGKPQSAEKGATEKIRCYG